MLSASPQGAGLRLTQAQSEGRAEGVGQILHMTGDPKVRQWPAQLWGSRCRLHLCIAQRSGCHAFAAAPIQLSVGQAVMGHSH